MTNKLSEKDKKDWKKFLDSSEKLEAKDIDQSNSKNIIEMSIDLHGFTLEKANEEIRYRCFLLRSERFHTGSFSIK